VNTRVTLLFVLTATLLWSGCACAEVDLDPGPDAMQDVQLQDLPEDVPGDEGAEPEPDQPGIDKCDQQPSKDSLVENVQSGTFEYTCRTIRWFDSLFGNSRDFKEEQLFGRLSLGTAWSRYEGFDPSLRFRLRTDLPNVSSRWNAFFGRVDEEDFIRGTETQQDSAFRRGINDSDQPEWLFGLGYKGRKPGEAGWDFSLGVRLRLPPQPYARAMYTKSWNIGRRHDLRYRQTFFARYDRGYGTTTSFDTVRELSDDDILRLELIGTLADYTEGVDWWAAHTWYHRLARQRGISLRSFARGRTKGEVTLTEFGLELSWRRQLNREWLFINAGPTLTWPRYFEAEKREASWGFAVLLEMDFGYYLD
jgi:hypothetical protein